jgi:hypothetical protein
MKPKKWLVIFETGRSEIVTAFCEKEAGILAQAEQIKAGNLYTIKTIKEI